MNALTTIVAVSIGFVIAKLITGRPAYEALASIWYMSVGVLVYAYFGK